VDPLRELVVAFAVARALAKFTFALAWAIGNVFELFWRCVSSDGSVRKAKL